MTVGMLRIKDSIEAVGGEPRVHLHTKFPAGGNGNGRRRAVAGTHGKSIRPQPGIWSRPCVSKRERVIVLLKLHPHALSICRQRSPVPLNVFARLPSLAFESCLSAYSGFLECSPFLSHQASPGSLGAPELACTAMHRTFPPQPVLKFARSVPTPARQYTRLLRPRHRNRQVFIMLRCLLARHLLVISDSILI
jgi:hypothetical protein